MAAQSIPGTNAPSDSPFIPRFSDPRDIDEFVDKLEAFERGELNPDAFRAFRLLRGVYGQRQSDVQMFRIKIPYGILGKAQLDAIADVADKYSRGYGHVTTRQNIQLHFMQMHDSEASMRRLDEAGLTSREACGNSVRNVTACEIASVCTTAPFDVTPYAEAVVRYFLRHPLASTLPRKFKIAFSGCSNDCAKGAIHDLGFIAKVEGGVPGFKVLVAGGLSTLPISALVLHEFVPAAEIGRVGEAILRLFHGLGNRENKHRARLKYVLKKLGEESFRAKYMQIRAEVDAEAKGELKLPETPAATPAAPVMLPSSAGLPDGYLAWRAASIVDQRQDGYAAVYVRLPIGDITSSQMRALGPILEQFGDGSCRLTIDQNIVIPYVDKRSLPTLYVALKEIKLAELGIRTAKDVLSCPGAESCNLAVTASRSLATAITERLEESDTAGLDAMADTSIKISGCPHSCGQHHIADIGFHGAARKEGGQTVPMYQLHLGGGVDETGAHFGRQVVKIIARRVPAAVVKLMALYQSDRIAGEKVTAFYRRVDPKRVVAALGDLLGNPTSDEAADIGESVGFKLHTGEGECAA